MAVSFPMRISVDIDGRRVVMARPAWNTPIGVRLQYSEAEYSALEQLGNLLQ
jgi:hypothetical protein